MKLCETLNTHMREITGLKLVLDNSPWSYWTGNYMVTVRSNNRG